MGLVANIRSPARLTAELGNVKVIGSAEVYDGSYEVIPAVDPQTLLTKNKLMINDVEVLGVPYFEVQNEMGGDTVYIAAELQEGINYA